MSIHKKFSKINDFERKIFPDKFIYDPVFVINRFNSAIEKYSEEKVLKGQTFSEITRNVGSSVFLLSFYEITKPKIDYWLKSYYDQWPDAYGVFFSPRKDIENTDIQNMFYIEITEQDEYSSKEIFDQILAKIRKNYPKHHYLVVYLKKLNIRVDLELVFKKLKKYKVLNLFIFILTSDINKHGDPCVVCVHSEYRRKIFYLQKLMLKLKKSHDFIEAGRRRGRDISPPTPKPFPLPELE